MAKRPLKGNENLAMQVKRALSRQGVSQKSKAFLVKYHREYSKRYTSLPKVAKHRIELAKRRASTPKSVVRAVEKSVRSSGSSLGRRISKAEHALLRRAKRFFR